MNHFRAGTAALLAAVGVYAFGAVNASTAAYAAPPRRVRVTVGQADYRFLFQTAQGSLYERRLAQLAETKASQSAVRDYARRLARDHGALQTELNRLLLDKGLTPVNSPSAGDKRRLARLSALRGRAFDRAFIREAVRINREDEAAGRREARRTRDRDIQAFLRRFAPTDAAHRRGALALRRTGGRSAA